MNSFKNKNLYLFIIVFFSFLGFISTFIISVNNENTWDNSLIASVFIALVCCLAIQFYFKYIQKAVKDAAFYKNLNNSIADPQTPNTDSTPKT